MIQTPNHSLTDQLPQVGLRALLEQLDDFLARATQARWSPRQIIEQLSSAETTERSRRSLDLLSLRRSLGGEADPP